MRVRPCLQTPSPSLNPSVNPSHRLPAPLQCLKFKTSHSLFLNRFEALNLALMQKMANRRPPAAPATVPLAVPAAAIPARQGTPMDVDAPAPAPGAAGAAGGGVKKKKPKKKK